MPVLHVSQSMPNIKQFFLPSTAGLSEDQQAWVKIDVGPETPADWNAYTDADQNYAVRMSRVMVQRIKEWNFVDESGNQVPIDFNSFWSLAAADRLYILSIQLDAAPGAQPLTLTEKKS